MRNHRDYRGQCGVLYYFWGRWGIYKCGIAEFRGGEATIVDSVHKSLVNVSATTSYSLVFI